MNNSYPAWIGAILAGGRATRFDGRNKATLPLGPNAILERQLAVLRAVVDRTVIIANDEAPYARCGVPVFPDLVPEAGPLGGIYTAITTGGAAHTLIVACDMPFLSAAFLSHLVALGRDVDIAIPRTSRGYEPLCATYSEGSAAVLHQRIQTGRLKAADIISGADALTIREVGPEDIARYGRDDLLFFNINTADDLARAIIVDGTL